MSGHLQYYTTPPEGIFSRFSSGLSSGSRNHPKEGINDHCHFSNFSAVSQIGEALRRVLPASVESQMSSA